MLDIQVIFNGISRGLNDTTWASNLWLPTSLFMTRLVHFEYKVVDVYIGEIFPNFLLHEVLQVYLGVDLSPFKERICKEILGL